MTTRTEQLCAGVSKLEPLEFVGILHLLGIKITDSEENPRSFSDVIIEMTEIFETLTKRKQREILKLVKDLRKKK